ncbi:integrin alpha-1-like [Oculina patagonica]
MMVHLTEFAVLVVVICGIEFSFGDKSIGEEDYYESFQKIPPAIETARKLYKYFFRVETRRIHKRQILGNFFDVILVIDSSSSVSSGEFVKGLSALRNLVDKSRNDTNYAAITYATRAKIEFDFTSSVDAAVKFRALKRSGGKTNTQAALKLCQMMFVEDQYGARQGSFRRILLVTDGQSNINKTETIPSAEQLKIQMGIELFVIAVGEYLEGIKELVQIASSTDAHMYRVLNMRGLAEVIKLVPDVQKKIWIEETFGKPTGEGEEEAGPLGKL